MANIQVITDSMTDIPKELQMQYDIKIVPLSISFGEDTYLDGIDMTAEAFYTKLQQSEQLPHTAQATPYQFQTVFEEALRKGKQVLCVNASSKASGTHQSALIARETIGSPDIQVVDTLGLCMGAGLTVIETARFIEGGGTLPEAGDFALRHASGMKHIFTVDTVTYLQKGGRIAPGKAMMANILNIKPILTVVDGLVEPLDKVRGARKVIDKIVELSMKYVTSSKVKTIAVAHAHDDERAFELQKRLEEALNPDEIIVADIGCTIGTHTGPGTLAVFFSTHE